MEEDKEGCETGFRLEFGLIVSESDGRNSTRIPCFGSTRLQVLVNRKIEGQAWWGKNNYGAGTPINGTRYPHFRGSPYKTDQYESSISRKMLR